MPTQRRETLDGGIRAVLVVPDGPPTRPLALWLTHLGGSLEQTLPMLDRLAAAGHPAASFDPPGHGERGDGDPWGLARHVLGAFRRRMWPILGQCTLEATRVLDWAAALTGAPAGPIVAGGVSMGGDIAVALAGIDERVSRATGIGSTPDWRRPDMRVLDDPETILDQGDADRLARFYAGALDPMTHLDRYRRADLALLFLCGGADRHVPKANAETVAGALGERVAVEVMPGLDHMGVTAAEEAYAAAAAFLGGVSRRRVSALRGARRGDR